MMSLGREVPARRRPRIDLFVQKHFDPQRLPAAIGIAVVVGVLASVAVPAFMDHFMDHNTHCGRPEWSRNLNRIARNAKAYFATRNGFPKGTTRTMPACCPRACDARERTWTADPVWRALDFAIDESSYYQYRYESDGITFRATATACDGRTYVMKGLIDSGEPRAAIYMPTRD